MNRPTRVQRKADDVHSWSLDCARVRLRVGALTAAVLLVPSASRGDDGTRVVSARVAWVRDDSALSCPDALQIEARLRARLDADPFVGTPQRLIEAIVRRTDAGFVAHIAVRDVDGALRGTRDLSSANSDCSGIARAAIVTMALSLTDPIDPDDTDASSTAPSIAQPVSDASSPPTSDAPVSSSPPPTAAGAVLPFILADHEVPPPISDRQESRRSPEQPRPPSLAASVDAFVHAGVLPFVGIGGGVSAHARVHRFLSIGLGLAWLPDQRLNTTYGRYDFGLTTSHVDACVELSSAPRNAVSLCAGGWLGAIHSVVYVAQPVSPGLTAWFGLSATARASLHIIGPLEVQAEAGALVPLSRYHYVHANPNTEVFVQARVGFVGRIGIGVRFR